MDADLTIGTQGRFEHIRGRMRALRHASIQWALIGGFAGAAWSMLLSMPMLEYAGPIAWLFRGLFTSFIPVLILAIAIVLSAETGTELAQRPMRLLLAVALAATLSLAPIWAVDALSGFRPPLKLPSRLMYWWLNVMLLGSTFCWAAVLSLRHREDQNRLASLLSRRSLLARQVAQSRLMAARAQVDPAMIARILNDVRRRYRSDENAASTLLDQLIAYLRLAMNRMRELQASFAGELSMVRSYLALRRAETNLQIDLQISAEVQNSGQSSTLSLPLFLLVKRMVDEAGLTGAESMALRIEPANQGIVVTLELCGAAVPEEGMARLRAAVRELSIDGMELDILHHSLDSGVNRYVGKASIDPSASASDRIDRRG